MNINDLKKEDWEKLYIDEEKTLTQLAETFEVNPTTIMNRLKKFGVSRASCGNKRKTIISEEDIKKAYFTDKLSIASMSKLFGVTHKSIVWHMGKYGIERNKLPKEVLTSDFLLECLNSNLGPYDIAKKSGFSIPVIYKYLYKYDLADNIKKGNRRFSANEELFMCGLYDSGLTIPQISEKYKCSPKVINDILIRGGIDIRDNNSYVRKVPDIDEVKNLYFEDNLSLSEIAKKYGCTKNAVYQLFKRNGIDCKTKSEAMRGESNPIFGVGHKDEAKEKMVSAYINEIRKPFASTNFVTSTVNTMFQGVVVVRSSWEAAVIRYFNSNNVLYMYEPRTFLVEVDGKNVSYLPDFYLLKEDLYVEVKGWEKEDGIKKFEAFKLLGYNAELWNKEVLIDLGIIDTSFKVIV